MTRQNILHIRKGIAKQTLKSAIISQNRESTWQSGNHQSFKRIGARSLNSPLPKSEIRQPVLRRSSYQECVSYLAHQLTNPRSMLGYRFLGLEWRASALLGRRQRGPGAAELKGADWRITADETCSNNLNDENLFPLAIPPSTFCSFSLPFDIYSISSFVGCMDLSQIFFHFSLSFCLLSTPQMKVAEIIQVTRETRTIVM